MRNHKFKILIILILVSFLNGYSKKQFIFPVLKGHYFGQKPPGLTPEIFAPGIISTIHKEHSSLAFSPDGKEIYWSIWPKSIGKKRKPQQIMYTKVEKGYWKKPEIASFSGQYMDGGPCFSPNGKILYFYSKRPLKKGDKPQKYLDIWMVKRTKSGWLEPQPMPSPINSEFNDASPFIDKSGNFYLSRKTKESIYNDIFFHRIKNGKYLKGQKLSINMASARESSFAVSKDDSYILFTSDDREFKDGKRIRGDRNMMVSFKNKDGKWGKAINAGKVFNEKKARFPSFSFDGKYVFFTRYDKNGNEDFYWVDTKIIEKLRPKSLK